MANLFLTIAPCSPEAAGLDPESPEGKEYQAKIDKRRTNRSAGTIDRFTEEFCSACPNRLAEFCESQGFYTNLDGNLVLADGIFGGYTEAERKVRGPRKFAMEA